MKAVHASVLVGNTVSVRMEHSNEKALDVENKGDVLPVSVVAPLGYSNKLFTVQLNAQFSSFVTRPVTLQMFGGRGPVLDISKSSVPFDFARGSGVRPLGKYKF